MSTSDHKWVWERIDAGKSGASGDLAKLFKNEDIRQPGILATGAPSSHATLLAREVIQNSWDAARELRSEMDEVNERPPSFHIDFAFREASGDEKSSLVSELGLEQLAARAREFPRGALGLREHDCLEELESSTPLAVLEIRESGTTGMYGPFTGAKSKLYLALVSLGFTVKQQGDGGSYGYGKAGLIRGSAIHSVLAYTCFREREGDPGVSRRLLGMTYWGLHSDDESNFNGYARLGDHESEDLVSPLINEDADRLAAALGLDLRAASDPNQLGTTFVLVQPTVEPHELKVAIERNWWPALQDRSFTASVLTSTGDTLFPKPKANPVLQSFIEAYEIAVGSDDPKPPEQAKPTFRSIALETNPSARIGALGLVAEVNGWSYPHQAEPVEENNEFDHTGTDHSLVALVRGPRMVVEYLDLGSATPLVRGTFVADHDVDDLLRQTEPKAHDSWQTTRDEDIAEDAPKVARAVLQRVTSQTRSFRNGLRPPMPPKEDIRLPLFEDLFKNFLRGDVGDRRVPPADPRLISIHVDQQAEIDPNDPTQIRLVGSARVALSTNAASDSSEGFVQIRYFFHEEGKQGDRCELDIVAPKGFAIDQDADSGRFVGTLTRRQVEFTFTSRGYSSDWTGRLVVGGDILTGRRQAPAAVGVDADE